MAVLNVVLNLVLKNKIARAQGGLFMEVSDLNPYAESTGPCTLVAGR
jgi:hypothetical protein